MTQVGNELHPALVQSKLTGELGHLSPRELSDQYVRITTGLWVDRRAPNSLVTRSVALTRLYPCAVLCGWSALALHGFQPESGSLPELNTGKASHMREGVIFRRSGLHDSVIMDLQGVRVTTPEWSAYDIARNLPLRQATAALEGLTREGLDLDRLHRGVENSRGRWGSTKARRALSLMDLKSQSHMETHVRIDLALAGFKHFDAQVEVPELGYVLDLAHRWLKVGVEYDGRHHRNVQQEAKDSIRLSRLRAAGWIIIRVDYATILHRREQYLAKVRSALDKAAAQGILR